MAAPEFVYLCADHRLPIERVAGERLGAESRCPMGHKVQRYRRLDKSTGVLSPVAKIIDPKSVTAPPAKPAPPPGTIVADVPHSVVGPGPTAIQHGPEAVIPRAPAAPKPPAAPPAEKVLKPAGVLAPATVPEDPRPRCRDCSRRLGPAEVKVGRGTCVDCEARAGVPVVAATPRKAVEIVRSGIYTDVELAELVNAVMLETLDGSMESDVAAVMLNGAGRVLRIAEARARRGSQPTYEEGGGLVLVGRRK